MAETWRVDTSEYCTEFVKLNEKHSERIIFSFFFFFNHLVCLVDLFSCPPYTVYTLICFWFMGTIKRLLL